MPITLVLIYGIPVVAAAAVFAALSLVGLMDLDSARKLQLYRDYATVEADRTPEANDSYNHWQA